MEIIKEYYKLGIDENNNILFLESPKKNNNGSWIFGKVVVLKDNEYEEFRDFEDLFLCADRDLVYNYRCLFKKPVNMPDDKIYMLLDYMKICYALSTAEKIYRTGKTDNWDTIAEEVIDKLKDNVIAYSINEEKLPLIFGKVRELFKEIVVTKFYDGKG